MARRASSKALHDYVLLWISPILTVVVLPIFLHAAAEDASNFYIVVALVLLLVIVSLSGFGCVVYATCRCPKQFPLVLLLSELTLLLLALVLKSPILQEVKEKGHKLHHAPDTRQLFPTALTPTREPAPLPSAIQQRPELTHGGASQSTPFPSAVMRLDASAPKEQRSMEELPDVKVAIRDRLGLYGWSDAGDGYCEDGDSKQEFNSVHALGMTLQECVDAGSADKISIALDFSKSDGGCDIRYTSGALPKTPHGFQWWGWGAGEGNPRGFGTQKHNTQTRCYAKILPRTTPLPPGATRPLTADLHPGYGELIRENPFQSVKNEKGDYVNIILVKMPFGGEGHEKLFHKYKDQILFLGISSYEDYPLPSPNPFSGSFAKDKYVGLFPGFLHMFRDTTVFPSHVKLLLLSQSDFGVPNAPAEVPKKYDFTFSGSDQDVANDCVGWANFAKNWSFVKQALEVMCGELRMTGVLVASIDKQNSKRCTIPESCKGLMTQTQYISQDQFHEYVKQSRFLLLPQVHDASPRVSAQALALNVPLLMNRNIMGGWKYINEKTGEFFNDMSDFRTSLQRLMHKVKTGAYEPRKYVDQNCGDDISGRRLKQFVVDNFADRVLLPAGTEKLLPA